MENFQELFRKILRKKDSRRGGRKDGQGLITVMKEIYSICKTTRWMCKMIFPFLYYLVVCFKQNYHHRWDIPCNFYNELSLCISIFLPTVLFCSLLIFTPLFCTHLHILSRFRTNMEILNKSLCVHQPLCSSKSLKSDLQREEDLYY